MKLNVVDKSLFFISPKGCSKKSIKNTFSTVTQYKRERLILIMYYHILNNTHKTPEMLKFIKALNLSQYVQEVAQTIEYNSTEATPVMKVLSA